MSERKELGRIKNLRVGHGGYQDSMFGVSFDLGGEAWGVADFIGMWSPALIGPRSEHAKWSEADRDKQFAEVCHKLDKLLKEAHVNDVMKLVGKPVEVIFDDNMLKSWRLLTEVL